MTIDTAVLADLEAGRIHLDRGSHPDRSHSAAGFHGLLQRTLGEPEGHRREFS